MLLALSKHDCGDTSERVAGCASSLLVHALTSRCLEQWTVEQERINLFWFPPVPTVSDAGPSILTKRNCQDQNESEI